MNNLIDGGVYSYQSLAWKIIMDELNDEQMIELLNPNENDDDPMSYTFEFMLNIFLEMIIDCAIISHLSENNESDKINPNLNNLNSYLPTIETKLKNVNIGLYISEYDQNPDNMIDIVYLNRYCRIILRNNKNDIHLFEKYNVPEDQHYYMLLNKEYVKKSKLSDIYAITTISDISYRISFFKIK